jgi:hypothetical protein
VNWGRAENGELYYVLNSGSLRRPDEIRFPRHLFGRTRRQQKGLLNTRERGIKRGGVVKIPVDKPDV